MCDLSNGGFNAFLWWLFSANIRIKKFPCDSSVVIPFKLLKLLVVQHFGLWLVSPNKSILVTGTSVFPVSVELIFAFESEDEIPMCVPFDDGNSAVLFVSWNLTLSFGLEFRRTTSLCNKITLKAWSTPSDKK